MQPSIHTAWCEHRDAETILIDIPIGLPTEERRGCDEKAREYLGSARGNSVFWTPCRQAVYESSYEKAKETNKTYTGNSVSSQSWGVIPRIREVDTLLDECPGAREKIRESHPEVCFAGLNGGTPLSTSKADQDGRKERKKLFESIDPSLEGVYDRLVCEHIETPPAFARRIGTNNREDLLDAMVLAKTASLGPDKLERIHCDPPCDGKGFPMEIVFVTRG